MTGRSRFTSRAFAAFVCTMSVAALPLSVARAQATTVTFNSLTESSPGSGVRFISNCYSEGGFTFTAVGVPCTGAASMDVFVAAGPNEPLLGGGSTPSLLLNSPSASLIDVMRTAGGPFNLNSIMLAPFLEANTTVLFTGMLQGGGMTTLSVFLLGTQTGFQMFSFSSAFSNLTSLRIAATNSFDEPLVKFDNVSATVVPEPSTVLLCAAGLIALAAAARQRRVGT